MFLDPRNADSSATDPSAAAGKDAAGARGIRRLVERMVADPIAEALIQHGQQEATYIVGLPTDAETVKILLSA